MRGAILDAGDGIVAEVDRIDEAGWSEALQAFADATIYQTWAYGSVRWGANRLSHMVVKQDGRTVGLAQVMVKSIPLIRAGVAYVPWGPLWCTGSDQDAQGFRHVLRALKTYYVKEKGCLLRFTPHVFREADCAVQSYLEQEGFVRIGDGYRTFLLDLSASVDNLRKTLNQKWRNMLNRAERNDLAIVEGSNMELYRIFLELQQEMQQRKNYVPGVDYEEFRQVQERLPESQKMSVVVCVYSGKPIAAVIVSALGDRGIYLLGATGNDGLNLRGSYLLQWRVIQWLKDRGCHWYDLGGIDPADNPGVYHFKSGMGGTDSSLIGRFENSAGPLSSICVRSAEFIRSRVRRGRDVV